MLDFETIVHRSTMEDFQMGVLFAFLSAVFMAATVIIDRFIVADWYRGSAKASWTMSSLTGATLGSIATAIVWYADGPSHLWEIVIGLWQTQPGLLGIIILSGGVSSLTLYSYFNCFSARAESTLVAIAIAATPLFVFLASRLTTDQSFSEVHWWSLALALGGLFGYQLSTGDRNWSVRGRIIPLIGVMILGTGYVITLDYGLELLTSVNTVSAYQAALIALPFYWIGFALGTLGLVDRSVRGNLHRIITTRTYLFTLLVMELIGMSFYFFEVFGLSGLHPGLVAIIVGAHVVVVWFFDLYLHRKLKYPGTTYRFLWICTIKHTDLNKFNWVQIVIQAVSITLVIVGIVIWPIE